MRLSEIEYKINSMSENLEYYYVDSDWASTGNYKIKNISAIKNLVIEIENRNFDFYKNEISKIKKSSIYNTTHEFLIVSEDENNLLLRNVNRIVDSLISLSKILPRITPTKNENSFLIKLPQPNNFEDLTKDLTKIQKNINQILIDKKINTTAEINNWEYGSFWIDLVIGTQAALGLLASITWTAAYISKELKKNKEANLYLERIGYGNEHLKTVLETQKVYMEKIYENEILNIQENYFDNEEDIDRNLRIKSTIKLFADIIERGGEIQPSLIAPEKMKNQFPDITNIDMIESQVKRISEKPESKKSDSVNDNIEGLNDNLDMNF